MFWGLIVEPGKSYKQTVEKSFHVSMACLQPDKCKDSGYVSFILRTVGQEFVLCNLQKGSSNQVQLDLNFNAGDEIAFTTSGAKNTVHLSGYLIVDEDMDDDMFTESDSEIDPADLKELYKKRKNQLEHAGSGKIPKMEKVEDEDEEAEEEEDDDDDDSSDDAFDSMVKLEAIDEGDEESDEDDEDDEEEEEEAPAQSHVKTKGNKTPTAPTTAAATTPSAQTNGNGPASGKKNKKNKETPKNNTSNANSPNVQKTPKTPSPGTPSKKTLEGGVMIEDLKVGNGPQARSGQMVKVYYTGRLKSNNKQFDANNSGKPFGFRLGRGEVIKGWDIGVCGMQMGGKRKITIPAALAYGSKGAPPSIPPNSILVFDVEMKGLH